MSQVRLVFDPIACDGHGLCAELLPELVALDDWGYPIVLGAEVPADLETYARRAVAACPKLALRLEAVSGVARRGGVRAPVGDRRPVRREAR